MYIESVKAPSAVYSAKRNVTQFSAAQFIANAPDAARSAQTGRYQNTAKPDGFWKWFDDEINKMKEEEERYKKAQKKIKEEKRKRDMKLSELRGLIAHYENKLSAGVDIDGSKAMISSLKTKLFWTMFGM